MRFRYMLLPLRRACCKAKERCGDSRLSGAVLQVKDLCVCFQSGAQTLNAVDHVSFTLMQGEILGIVGESGSGESTLAFTVLNMIPKPNGKLLGGEVIYKGQDLLKYKHIDLIRGTEIAMVMQNAMSVLDPVFTIGNQLMENIRTKSRVGRKEAYARSLRILRQLEFEHPELVMKSYPHELSGGMRQRVLIGMAIANDPSIIIADEPTTALDVIVQKKIITLLKKIVRERNISLILVTHNLGLVWEICDRAMVMKDGRIVEKADVKELYDHPIHPYTRGLLKSIPTFHSDSSAPLPTVEEEIIAHTMGMDEDQDTGNEHYVLFEGNTENYA